MWPGTGTASSGASATNAGRPQTARASSRLSPLRPRAPARGRGAFTAGNKSRGERRYPVDAPEGSTALPCRACRFPTRASSSKSAPGGAEVIPNTRLPAVTAAGVTEMNQPIRLGRTTVLANRLPSG